MSRPPAIDWNVKARVPDGANPKGSNKKRYARVNIMCLLLEGTDYNTLYSRNAVGIYWLLKDTFIPKIQSLTGAKVGKYFGTGEEARRRVLLALDTLLTEVSAYPTITFRDLYLRPTETEVATVRSAFEDFAKQHGERFCLPFLVRTTDEVTLEGFLTKYGGYDLYDLFTSPRRGSIPSDGTDWDDKVELNNRKLGPGAFSHPFLMVDPSSPPKHYSAFFDPDEKCSDPNDHCCRNNACVYVPGSGCFCSTVEGGGCSLASCCP